MDDLKAVLQDVKRCSASFTGRRTYRGEADEELRAVVSDLHDRGISRFLCGMSWGWDLAAGCAVAEFKRTHPYVELVAVEPFAEFRSLFSGEDGELYDRVLAAADCRVVVSEQREGAYRLRNDFLVDNAAVVVAWWDGEPHGGTAYTVGRARRKRLEIVNLYPQPQLELEF